MNSLQRRMDKLEEQYFSLMPRRCTNEELRQGIERGRQNVRAAGLDYDFPDVDKGMSFLEALEHGRQRAIQRILDASEA